MILVFCGWVLRYKVQRTNQRTNRKTSTSKLPVIVGAVAYEKRHALEEKAGGEGGEDDFDGGVDDGR